MSNALSKNVTVICDLQFGSTGKGLIAGYLAERDAPDVVVTAWSMNAGHTYVNDKGRKFVHCMLANGVVSPNLKYVLIGPGSQIGIEKLFEEVEQCRDLLAARSAVVLIHENAAVIQQRHIDAESESMTKIGSTKKGCGAALVEKIQRQGTRITARSFDSKIEDMAAMRKVHVAVITDRQYADVIDSANRIQVEGAQGYSLGINSGFYPYVTSRECTPAQILVDAGVPIAKLACVVGTMRTYPIRVANRYDEKGNMIGYSGPCYHDQYEIEWSDLGRKAELTTVTQLPRRIFTFSRQQTEAALRMCRPDEIFLNFLNYLDQEEQGGFVDSLTDVARKYGSAVRYLGYGPTRSDVFDVMSNVAKRTGGQQ